MEERKITPDALWRMMADAQRNRLSGASYPAIKEYFRKWSWLQLCVLHDRDTDEAYHEALAQYTAAMEWLEENQPQ